MTVVTCPPPLAALPLLYISWLLLLLEGFLVLGMGGAQVMRVPSLFLACTTTLVHSNFVLPFSPFFSITLFPAILEFRQEESTNSKVGWCLVSQDLCNIHFEFLISMMSPFSAFTVLPLDCFPFVSINKVAEEWRKYRKILEWEDKEFRDEWRDGGKPLLSEF